MTASPDFADAQFYIDQIDALLEEEAVRFDIRLRESRNLMQALIDYQRTPGLSNGTLDSIYHVGSSIQTRSVWEGSAMTTDTLTEYYGDWHASANAIKARYEEVRAEFKHKRKAHRKAKRELLLARPEFTELNEEYVMPCSFVKGMCQEKAAYMARIDGKCEEATGVAGWHWCLQAFSCETHLPDYARAEIAKRKEARQ